MNTVIDQAEALRRIIEGEESSEIRQQIAEAVVGCCSDLIDAGEPSLGLALATIPVLALYFAGQKYFIRGMVAGAVK